MRDIGLTIGFGLPAIAQDYKQYHENGRNRLLKEEQGYETNTWEQRWTTLNNKQTIAADAIWEAVTHSTGQLFFLNGYRGTCKTMLQNTVLQRVQDDSKVAIAVASSEIAAILFQGAWTAHSCFKIPLNATAQSSCGVSKKSDLSIGRHQTHLLGRDLDAESLQY